MDLVNGRLFEVSVETLVHIGVYNLRLFKDDLKSDEEKTGHKFRLLGRPAIPAVILHSFHQFAEAT